MRQNPNQKLQSRSWAAPTRLRSGTPRPALVHLGRAPNVLGVAERPSPKSAIVSAQMSRMPRASTGPELALRRELHARGLRFRTLVRHLPGTPDVVFTRAKLAIFVDGCFWHGCPDHCVKPKNNAKWWVDKLAANVARDRRKDAELATLGWSVLHFWEHSAVEEVADEVERVWLSRTGRL